MRRAVFAIPGSLDTPTGGYAYDKRIIAELRALGWRIDVVDLGDTFPFPDDSARDRASRALDGIATGSVVVIDGLALGVLPDEAEALARRCRVAALLHHPLALETGLTAEQALALKDSETAALRHAHAVIATSVPTQVILETRYDVEARRISVVLPGVDRPARAPRDKVTRDDVRIFAVGSLVARKGYDLLVAALADLQQLPWRLVIAGDMTRDVRVTDNLKADIRRFGLADRIDLAGAVTQDELRALYADADLFALASRFEGYGMVFSEAIAAGLPVVATDVGGAREVIGDAGIIIPADDSNALKIALGEMIASRDLRAAKAAAASARAVHLPQWRESGAQFAQILERMI